MDSLPFAQDFQQRTYEKISIRSLRNAPLYPVIYGVVVGKASSRCIPTKTGNRFILSFVIRDSPYDSIYASCWGNATEIQSLCASFATGDVVEIKNPQVIEKNPEEAQEKYKPKTTSYYALKISVRDTVITVCSGNVAEEYRGFLHYPVYSATDCLSLADIVYNSQNAEGILANLLVTVKHVGKLEELTTKNGRNLKKLEIMIFDHSHPSFPVVIWDEETAIFLLKYVGKRSVLMISDVRLNYNKFSKGMAAMAVSNTIFTPEPELPNIRSFYDFAKTAIIEDSDPKGNNGKDLYTVQQVVQLLYDSELSAFGDTEGMMFAYLSHFDIDGASNFTTLRCPECKVWMKSTNMRCVNGLCDVGAGSKIVPPEAVFNLSVNVSDHTGTLRRCLMYDSVVVSLLNCTASEFLKLPEDKKTELKWRYLLEKCKIEFKIPQVSAVLGKRAIRINSCKVCDFQVLATHMKQLF